MSMFRILSVGTGCVLVVAEFTKSWFALATAAVVALVALAYAIWEAKE